MTAVYDSPCAVLGVSSPAGKRGVTKAYRALSMCTHPDRLVSFDAEGKVRGEVLFTRATEARDTLQAWMETGGRRRDNCRENPQCESVKKHYSEKIFAKKCDKAQAEVFRASFCCIFWSSFNRKECL